MFCNLTLKIILFNKSWKHNFISLTIMRAAFGISFSCTTRITTVSSVLNLTTTYTPKNVYNKSTRQIYESKTYTTMYTCTLLTHNRKKWISKKLKPRKCSWLRYLNKIIMKTCILRETSIYTSKKNSHKNKNSLSHSINAFSTDMCS